MCDNKILKAYNPTVLKLTLQSHKYIQMRDNRII